MRGDRHLDAAREAALKEELRAALAPPLDQVDWDDLHRRVMAALAARVPGAGAQPRDWIAAWAPRAIPVTAAALAAAIAVVSLWTPAPRTEDEGPPPEFWPVAVELITGLPHEAKQWIDAGSDPAGWIAAVFSVRGAERSP